VITFDPGLTGQTITLDGSSPYNHIKISEDLTIQGPRPGMLTISGENGRGGPRTAGAAEDHRRNRVSLSRCT